MKYLICLKPNINIESFYFWMDRNLIDVATFLRETLPDLKSVNSWFSDYKEDNLIMNENFRSVVLKIRRKEIDGAFIFHKNEWHIIDHRCDNCNGGLVRITDHVPDYLESETELKCTCEIKLNNSNKSLKKPNYPSKKIFTYLGFMRFCTHCSSYEIEDNFYKKEYPESFKVGFETVCKKCYIPYFKPYKMKKNKKTV